MQICCVNRSIWPSHPSSQRTNTLQRKEARLSPVAAPLSDGDKKQIRLAIAEITGIKAKYAKLGVDEALTAAIATLERHV
jgi:hypothetical protein